MGTFNCPQIIMHRFVTIVVCLTWIMLGNLAFGETRVRVGIFQNKPLSFVDEEGVASGIYPDIIREIAKKNSWKIDFVPDDWAGCLKRLESGDIDLIVSIARSVKREKIYDFSTIPVITSWGKVYTLNGQGISNILDLDQKIIGIVDRDITGKNLRELAQKFNVNASFALFPVYEDLCKALKNEKVDAIVMSNISGARFQQKYSLSPTSILFSPVDIYFAAPKNKNSEFLSAIDKNLAEWKKDTTSVYFAILDRWYGTPSAYFSGSMKWIIAGTAIVTGIALFLLAWNRSLGIRVKQHTQALKESESRYRKFIETAIEGIWALDKNFHVTFVNDTMANMLGYTSEEMLGQKADTFTFSEDLEEHISRMESRSRGLLQKFESRFKKKDGSELWAIVSATSQFNDRDEFDGAFAMFTDITDRKHTEKELQHTQNRFLAILNGIESTIYVADMDTYEILFMNDYMKDLFNADLTGEICWKAFRHQDKPCEYCTNRFLTNPDGQSTGIHLWEDKHPVTNRWNIYHDRAIRWVDGRLARLQIATDVTKLKDMELKQREYEDKIRQAQKMEALGALASGIAHDFNNILFPILGYAELLKEQLNVQNDDKSGLHEILAGAQRARDLVDQILTFSRQAEHKIAPLKPDIIVKEAIKLMRSTLPSTIRIEKYVAPDCQMIMADPTQIHQITMNLVTNAFHAMEHQGGTLTIRLENVQGLDHELNEDKSYIRLRVADTGVGMDETTLEKVLEPYFTTKPKGKGTGLGLSVVHGIIQEYSGEIKIHSELDRGTQIDIFIPTTDITKSENEHFQESPAKGGSERILLVDDEPQVLALEKEILTRQGYKVDAETSSKAALSKFKADPNRFDLIITDMTMPELTGDHLTQHIKETNPDMPVIICTGYSERINQERAMGLGINAYLTKPVSKTELVKTTRVALDG